MVLFELAYSEQVVLMWFAGFIVMQIAGTLAFTAFKTILSFIVGQTIAFIIIFIFFPSLFGLVS